MDIQIQPGLLLLLDQESGRLYHVVVLRLWLETCGSREGYPAPTHVQPAQKPRLTSFVYNCHELLLRITQLIQRVNVTIVRYVVHLPYVLQESGFRFAYSSVAQNAAKNIHVSAFVGICIPPVKLDIQTFSPKLLQLLSDHGLVCEVFAQCTRVPFDNHRRCGKSRGYLVNCTCVPSPLQQLELTPEVSRLEIGNDLSSPCLGQSSFCYGEDFLLNRHP
mmetsp:Transcript_63592/g.113165  ORF Transcript_63592/g.113165 Transcript_63592/m.113165 type:complete len:219 (+) Transcript_63592:424-1080(+)